MRGKERSNDEITRPFSGRPDWANIIKAKVDGFHKNFKLKLKETQFVFQLHKEKSALNHFKAGKISIIQSSYQYFYIEVY